MSKPNLNNINELVLVYIGNMSCVHLWLNSAGLVQMVKPQNVSFFSHFLRNGYLPANFESSFEICESNVSTAYLLS
jgi:hypothetical protein